MILPTQEHGISICLCCLWFLSSVSYNFLCTVLLSPSVQFSHVWLFATPWTSACQASLSITNSWSLLKLMSIVLAMPSNHLILCRPLLLLSSIFPRSGSSQMSWFFASHGQSIGISASASILPGNIQDWFPSGWTGWVSYSPRDSQESSPTPQFKSINSLELSFLYSPTLTSIHDYWKKNKALYRPLLAK